MSARAAAETAGAVGYHRWWERQFGIELTVSDKFKSISEFLIRGLGGKRISLQNT